MNPPQVYPRSPSWTLLPPPSPALPLGHPSAPAPSIQYRASNLDWRLISYMILYVFQCHWRRLLRVPWTARSSKQSILEEISPEYSLEGLMLKLKLQYFGHLIWRADSFEKTLMLGRLRAGGEGDDRGWYGWMASPTQWMGLGGLWELVTDRRPGVLRFTGLQSRTQLSDWTELNRCLKIQQQLAILLKVLMFLPPTFRLQRRKQELYQPMTQASQVYKRIQAKLSQSLLDCKRYSEAGRIWLKTALSLSVVWVAPPSWAGCCLALALLTTDPGMPFCTLIFGILLDLYPHLPLACLLLYFDEATVSSEKWPLY